MVPPRSGLRPMKGSTGCPPSCRRRGSSISKCLDSRCLSRRSVVGAGKAPFTDCWHGTGSSSTTSRSGSPQAFSAQCSAISGRCKTKISSRQKTPVSSIRWQFSAQAMDLTVAASRSAIKLQQWRAFRQAVKELARRGWHVRRQSASFRMAASLTGAAKAMSSLLCRHQRGVKNRRSDDVARAVLAASPARKPSASASSPQTFSNHHAGYRRRIINSWPAFAKLCRAPAECRIGNESAARNDNRDTAYVCGFSGVADKAPVIA